MIKEFKKRYVEEFEEGSELLWPSEEEDNITRNFYRDISHLSKKNNNHIVKTNLFIQIFRIIFGKGGSSPLK